MWYSYFDDINAIIFLAPISCFDEGLAEDREVNRLQDSILLWNAVCSSKLLAQVQMILVRPPRLSLANHRTHHAVSQFLNKWDLLKKKLERGTRFADSVLNYGDKPNDARSVAKCTSL